MKHIVQFSGGAGSWAAAMRVAERHGSDDLVLLCADTRSEHPDWREFVYASAALTGGDLVMFDQGVDVWELAFQQKMIPNTRVDFCSRILKREPIRNWMDEHLDPADATVYIGFDWTEEHRLVRARPHWEPWSIDAPLMWEPMLDKDDVLRWLDEVDLPMPAAYRTGMPHNNCLGTGCVKGGQAYWRKLRDEFPEAYERSALNEEEFRRVSGKDVAILRDRRGGVTKPLTLYALAEMDDYDTSDWGSCSCMSPGAED